MKSLNQLLQKRVLGVALIPLAVLLTVSAGHASQVASEWFFGNWKWLMIHNMTAKETSAPQPPV
jgi:hypothetical protein